MKYTYIFIIIFIQSNLIFGQKLINNESFHFSIDSNNIDFLIIDNDLSQKKPIFIWFQGSRPYPLYTIQNNKLIFWGGGLSNFDLALLRKTHHIVVISMPTVPVIVSESELSSSYQYVPNKDNDEPSIEFQKADNVENYVERATKVWTYLKQQTWVDNSKLVIAGHSQGTRIASQFALHHQVNTVALFSPNPHSRILEMIRKPFIDAKNGKITWEEADKEIKYYQDLSNCLKNDTLIEQNPSLIAWKSFNTNPIEDWMNLKSNLYIAYGTEDNSADFCALIPYYFIEKGRQTPVLRRYIGRDHNFFLLKDGKPDYTNIDGWYIAFSDFVKWLDNQK